jgi:Ca2+-binding RTX toxin-like protein
VEDDGFARAVAQTFPPDELVEDYVAEIIEGSISPETYTHEIKASTGTTTTPKETTVSSGRIAATPATESYGKELFFPVSPGDTTCDGKDDDADGETDEGCTFGPADCPAGMNVIAGTGHADWLWGTGVADCILGYGGRDVLIGLDGNDLIVGGPGDDALRGSRGDDQLLGGSDDDLLYGDDGNDYVDGGEGNDVLFGAKGNDRVDGGTCHDLVLAASGTDVLRGEDGSDRIEAGAPHGIDGGGGIDACDGTSCELSAFAGFCIWDGDCPAGKRCTRLSHICVSTSVVPFTDEVCDGSDDDCDGRIDEEYTPTVVTCACGGSGVTACVNGEVVDDCAPGGGGGGPDATCDGIDDDCDTHFDEDYASTPTSCGLGACAATGSLLCMGGMPADSCVPLPAAGSDATCNGVDEDCNGTADEDYVSAPSTCGVGACSASGVVTCVSGATADSCLPGTAAASDATCDGIDDDCSGTADEDHASSATSCDTGGCVREGVLQCTAGAIEDTCPGSPCIAETFCNDDLDNDADTLVDCDDGDCGADPICEVQSFSATVLGSSSLWGAGHAVAPGGGALPPGIIIALGPGAVVTFTSITGLANQGGGNLPPDGTPGVETLPDTTGLAGFTHATLTRSLAGVFLTDAVPVNPPPAQLAFPHGEFTEAAPGLRQLFFIGNGLTSGAVQQRFVVPAGATRLFLGLTDRCTGNIPGCFGTNTGFYSVAGEIRYD